MKMISPDMPIDMNLEAIAHLLGPT